MKTCRMKSYNVFKDLIENEGPFKLAWFTSFNFNIQFFEKYMLSIFSEQDYKDLRNVKDYELMNQNLFGDLDDQLDCCAFYDYRALKLNDKAKQTSVELIGINPKELGANFIHGVFHPKIILLVTKENKGYLIAGSANMSFSAWARNSESMIIKEIKDVSNAAEITAFFKSFIGPSKAETMDAINTEWQRTLASEKASWRFHHSFKNESILNAIQLKRTNFYIWSPYFSEELHQICKQDLADTAKINIIPDVTVNNEVKISNDVLHELSREENIELLKDNRAYDSESKPFVHAKILLNENSLAVGSWNCTRAGFNLVKGRSNVEAGVIIDIENGAFKKLEKSFKLDTLLAIGQQSSELKDGIQELLNDWKMTCQISIDWASFKYKVEDDLVFEKGDFFVSLPGSLNRIDLHDLQVKGLSFAESRHKLLKNRFFSIYSNQNSGEPIYVGILLEKNKSLRPARCFESVGDFFNAWLDERPADKTHTQTFSVLNNKEFDDLLKSELGLNVNGRQNDSWFTMFIAIEKIKKKLREFENDKKQLQILGTKMAGSVLELADHLVQFKQNKNANEIYKWFLLHEGNQVIKLYNTIVSKFDLMSISFVENIELEVTKKEADWIKYIQQECKYELK